MLNSLPSCYSILFLHYLDEQYAELCYVVTMNYKFSLIKWAFIHLSNLILQNHVYF